MGCNSSKKVPQSTTVFREQRKSMACNSKRKRTFSAISAKGHFSLRPSAEVASSFFKKNGDRQSDSTESETIRKILPTNHVDWTPAASPRPMPFLDTKDDSVPGPGSYDIPTPRSPCTATFGKDGVERFPEIESETPGAGAYDVLVARSAAGVKFGIPESVTQIPVAGAYDTPVGKPAPSSETNSAAGKSIPSHADSSLSKSRSGSSASALSKKKSDRIVLTRSDTPGSKYNVRTKLETSKAIGKRTESRFEKHTKAAVGPGSYNIPSTFGTVATVVAASRKLSRKPRVPTQKRRSVRTKVEPTNKVEKVSQKPRRSPRAKKPESKTKAPTKVKMPELTKPEVNLRTKVTAPKSSKGSRKTGSNRTRKALTKTKSRNSLKLDSTTKSGKLSRTSSKRSIGSTGKKVRRKSKQTKTKAGAKKTGTPSKK